MDKTVLIILIGKRKDTAVKVQQLLTAWGCLIKTRLGIHDGVGNQCSDIGLIILEIVAEKEKREELAEKLNNIRFGSVEIVVHQGKVVQLETHEKVRFDPPTLRDGEGI